MTVNKDEIRGWDVGTPLTQRRLEMVLALLASDDAKAIANATLQGSIDAMEQITTEDREIIRQQAEVETALRDSISSWKKYVRRVRKERDVFQSELVQVRQQRAQQAEEIERQRGVIKNDGIELFQLRKSVQQSEEARKAAEARAEAAERDNTALCEFLVSLPEKIMQIDSYTDCDTVSPFPLDSPTEEQQEEWLDEFLAALDEHVRGLIDDTLAELDRHTEGTSLAAESVRHPYRELDRKDTQPQGTYYCDNCGDVGVRDVTEKESPPIYCDYCGHAKWTFEPVEDTQGEGGQT